MRTRLRPLLAELHAHTTWSDGHLTLRQLVDLHGRRGFDVLCVTDHVVRADDPWCEAGFGVHAGNHAAYLAAVDREARRALSQYGLLLLPGLELTYNDLDPGCAAHAVAVGLRDFVPVDEGIDLAIETAAEAGAAVIAAHPFAGEESSIPSRLTLQFARDRDGIGALVHRHELFNRRQLFSWVAEAGLPAVAGGDVHLAAHLAGWKTLVPSAGGERAMIDHLRSPRPVYLACLEHEPRRLLAA